MLGLTEMCFLIELQFYGMKKHVFEKLSLVSYVEFPFINLTRCRVR